MDTSEKNLWKTKSGELVDINEMSLEELQYAFEVACRQQVKFTNLWLKMEQLRSTMEEAARNKKVKLYFPNDINDKEKKHFINDIVVDRVKEKTSKAVLSCED